MLGPIVFFHPNDFSMHSIIALVPGILNSLV
jgi:hypothetical protein